jgi:hypothetical protein
MKRKGRLIIATILLVVGISVMCWIRPAMYENKIRTEAPKFLEVNGLTIIQEGDYHFWYDEVDYTVKKDTITYNIALRLVKGGALSIITK